MGQIISVSCKLEVPNDVTQRIDETLTSFAEACNQILAAAQEAHCYNTTQLHHMSYYSVRSTTGLKANHVCQAIRRVIGALKAKKRVHKFRPTSLSLDARTFEYREATLAVGITLRRCRVWLPLRIGNYQLALLRGQRPTSAVLVKHRDGSYYIQIQVELNTPPTGKTPKVIGVDLGRRDIATTSTGHAWSGAKLQACRARFANTRESVQRKRTKSAKRLLRRLSGRERRFQKWVNHTISQQLVREAVQTRAVIALEDLTGIRVRVKAKGPKQRREGHAWAFYQLRQFITYKAALAGVGLVLVNPAYTSQTCHQCLWIGKRTAKAFACSHCGWSGDADFNGACNIAKLGAVVNQPAGSALFCSLNHSVQSIQVQSSLQTA